MTEEGKLITRKICFQLSLPTISIADMDDIKREVSISPVSSVSSSLTTLSTITPVSQQQPPGLVTNSVTNVNFYYPDSRISCVLLINTQLRVFFWMASWNLPAYRDTTNCVLEPLKFRKQHKRQGLGPIKGAVLAK